MLFKGRLRLPNDPGEGIPIDLELEDVFLSLDSEGEDFGEWRLDTVEITRLFSNQFALHLDGEEMVFIADDALGFAYDGLSAVEDVQSRLSKRRIFKGRKAPKKKSVAAESGPAMEELDSEPDQSPVAPTAPDVPMPEVVPFFPESSPSFAESVAESAVVDETIAPVAPKPIEIADTLPPAVSTPPPAVPPAPPVVEEPVVEESVAVTDPVSDVASPDAPAYDLPAASDVDDDELVIEDVSAYGYVPVASAPVDRSADLAEPDTSDDEDDIEIEEAAPATGAVLREVHPLGEPAPETAEPASTDPAAPAADTVDEPVEAVVPEPEPVLEAPRPDPEPAAPPILETATPVAEPAPVPSPPEGDSSFFAQWSSNGRAASEPELEPEPAAALEGELQDRSSSQTQKSGRHARSSGKSRSSRFGRKKSREPEEHEHLYESSKTVGGITRSVCAICGHVSFAGEDVYQGW